MKVVSSCIFPRGGSTINAVRDIPWARSEDRNQITNKILLPNISRGMEWSRKWVWFGEPIKAGRGKRLRKKQGLLKFSQTIPERTWRGAKGTNELGPDIGGGCCDAHTSAFTFFSIQRGNAYSNNLSLFSFQWWGEKEQGKGVVSAKSSVCPVRKLVFPAPGGRRGIKQCRQHLFSHALCPLGSLTCC